MELTVDELAARAGVTVRTVRFYATRGLLPPPRLRGRTGLYGPDHLARLELVRELQSLGLTLASIDKHLARIPLDASVEDLALQRALLSPWAPDRPEDLGRHELDRRAGRHLDDEAVASEELQQVFQDTVVRPYRERGRPPEERERLLELATKLKPLMIQSLVTSFQRAVDRAIRRSVPDQPR